MELKFPYIEDKGYHLEEEFLEALQDVPMELSTLIAIYIDEYCPKLNPDLIKTHLLAGIVHYNREPVPFVFEVSRPNKKEFIFTDLKFIDMDEHLDFINLNLYLTPDERFSYPGPYTNDE